MFTATLTIQDLDTQSAHGAAEVLIAVAAGDARPVFIEVTNQHTNQSQMVEIAGPTLLDLLHEHLDAWENEEESVQEEHEDLIDMTRKFLGRSK